MNGFKILLLLAATVQVASMQVALAQAEPGKERDYGWAINQADGVLEYIVQINPEKLLAMQQRSVKFPSGQETVSNMPRELVGRASRVVVRIGDEVLPRVPSLEQLEREPRITDPLNAGSTAMLPPGRMQDVESGVYNIQQRDAPPSLPALPNGLDSALSSRGGNLIDEASKAAGSLRDNVNALRTDSNGSLSDALPAFPDPTVLAQNFNNQPAGANDFLNSSRGGATSGTKFNNTAPPASPTNGTNPNSGLGTSNPLGNANSNPTRNPANLGTGSNTVANPPSNLPNYPDPRLSPPSLSNPSTLPQQQTPSQGFGTTPGLANRPGGWNTSPATNTNPNYSQNPDPYASPQSYAPNYTTTPAVGNQYPTMPLSPAPLTPAPLTNYQYGNPGYDRIATNTTLNNQPTNQVRSPSSETNNTSQTPLQSGANEMIDPTAKMDGVLQVLFLLSLVVNFYLGILIRKLLIRYRSLLTNVRQTAYT